MPAAFRRAVALPGAADPGAALAPADRRKAARESDPVTRASALAQAPEAAAPEQPQPPVAEEVEASGMPAGFATSVDVRGPGPDDGPVTSWRLPRPPKPVLAAAAIAGAALIAVPFMMVGSGHSRTTALPVANSTDGTVLSSGQALAPGEYTSTLPSPPASSPVSASPSHAASSLAATSALAAAGGTGGTGSVGTQATTSAARSHISLAAAISAAKASIGVGTTAAQALSLLDTAIQNAGVSPGQHICYRAYEAYFGWQKPVCDGDMAGTTGRSLAMEEIDVAVSGVNGVNGNSYSQNIGWKAKWSGAGDNADLYLGTTGQTLRLEALAMNIGSSSLCINAHIQNIGWQGQRCTNGSYVSAGTMGQSLRMEAIRLTV